MALSKKSTRKIIVDNEEYLWSVSQDSGYLVLVVQHDSGHGQKLEIVITDDYQNTVSFAEVELTTTTKKSVITPKAVQNLIINSLKIGWRPTVNGAPLQLSVIKNELVIRRGI